MNEPSSSPTDESSTSTSRLLPAWGGVLLLILALGAWADHRTGWLDRAFDLVAHQWYEVPVLAGLRRPTQLALTRMHLAVGLGLAALGLILAPRLDRHGRAWWAVFAVAYAIRAGAWIVGGNLPLVAADSCHYVEVASSILRGEGPVKHYADGFFIDYPAIREGRGALDDWATPLYAYTLAGAYRTLGIEPMRDLEETFAVAKGLSFLANLLTLPALYGLARRSYGRGVALGSVALLAVLPVHAIYAGFELRESLVGLTSVLAIWGLVEVWRAEGRRRSFALAALAGVLGGLTILARHTTLALMGIAGLYGLIAHGRRHGGPLLLWGATLLAVIAPWAIITARAYGEPFYTFANHFKYTPSWAVMLYAKGVPRATDFYNAANAPEILRVKVKALLIIAGYSTMMVGLPVALGYCRRLLRPGPDVARSAREIDRLGAWLGLAFVAATLLNIADVTHVMALGRYYMPLYAILLPTAVAGLLDWERSWSLPRRARPWLASTLVALLWSDPTWAHDATWLVGPYQLHWPALRAAGDWIREHPEQVPPDARIMAWFPWELRLASRRTTVLLPRSLILSQYEIDRIDETIRQYGVTHVLWGSFEPPPNIDPETYGPSIDRLRTLVGLVNRREIYRSPPSKPFPVRLYRLSKGGS